MKKFIDEAKITYNSLIAVRADIDQKFEYLYKDFNKQMVHIISIIF
jgi:hypothetical protein